MIWRIYGGGGAARTPKPLRAPAFQAGELPLSYASEGNFYFHNIIKAFFQNFFIPKINTHLVSRFIIRKFNTSILPKFSAHAL